VISSGRFTAAELTPTLSAPACSSASASATERTPPPTVMGSEKTARTARMVSNALARPSWVAEMSRIVSSSTPPCSYILASAAGSPQSRRFWNLVPFTTFPSWQSKQAITRLAKPECFTIGAARTGTTGVSHRRMIPEAHDPLISGWNWQARIRPRSKQPTNDTPCRARAPPHPAGMAGT